MLHRARQRTLPARITATSSHRERADRFRATRRSALGVTGDKRPCPKLDGVDYTEKLTEIIKNNDIKSVTMTRMEVPCCGGLEYSTVEALKASGKFIPWDVVTFSLDGKILDN